MNEPQYYMYSYVSDGDETGAVGQTFTATAEGDLNGDGVSSKFELPGAIQAGGVVAIAPNIAETDPEE